MTQHNKNQHVLKVVRFVSVLVSLVFLSACNGTTEEKPELIVETKKHLAPLMWAQTADAKLDAEAAIKQQDYRIYVAAGRGERAPGLDHEKASALKEKCGVKYIKGSTDALIDLEHKDMLKQAYAYAGEYNQLIADYCK